MCPIVVKKMSSCKFFIENFHYLFILQNRQIKEVVVALSWEFKTNLHFSNSWYFLTGGCDCSIKTMIAKN